MRHSTVAGLLSFTLLSGSPSVSVSTIVANDNRTPAGMLRDGVLTVHIEATSGVWFPHTAGDPGVMTQAFAESGRSPSIPGPLIRVPAGTAVDITLRNSIRNSPLVVHGLSADSVFLASGESRRVRFKLDTPGTYYYWGSTTGRRLGLRLHEDAELSGAIVVDDSLRGGRYSPPHDRILLIGLTADTIGSETRRTDREQLLFTINGRSWPHTERLEYELSDRIRWRLINTTADPHPMHLHGTYFTIESRGDGVRDSIYPVERREVANTDFMPPGGTMSISWTPEHPGNWLFHCHIPEHFGARGPTGELVHTSHGDGAVHAEAMSGLVMGVIVKAPRGFAQRAAPPPRKQLRLTLRPNKVAARDAASYGFAFDDANDSIMLAGNPIVLTRGDPAAITVVNKSDQYAAVHWHGIELESYFDGVPGFSGLGARLTPIIAPRDSFVARFTPPRSGTFMYHTHVGEGDLKLASLVGMIVVLNPGEKYDPEKDIPLLISSPTSEAGEAKGVLINGNANPLPIMLERGSTYRFRLANITARRPGIFAQVRRDSVLSTWTPVAKDGADLPAQRRKAQPARHRISIGETMDYQISPDQPGEMTFEVVTASGKPMAAVPIHVR